MQDAEHVGQLLALLGQSRLGSNLNQLAQAARQGSLPVTPEVEEDLRRACATIFEMRALLLRALGLQIIGNASPPLPLVEFTLAAGRPAE